jgi:hypothetical protein
MTNEHGADAKALVAGIRHMLADDSGGKRSLPWLSKKSGIKLTTLKRRLANPGDLTSDEVWALADAFGVDIRDLYTVGIEMRQAA